jgi:pyridoxamine-phosphate oxidase
MVLATADAKGQPSARIVLLKELNDEGFIFFTNYGSRKAHDIDENQRVCLLFYWDFLERQIRIEGPIEKISKAESSIYFQTRPRGSQIGAWASPQSQVIPGRSHLDKLFKQAEDSFKSTDKIDCPDHWGGFIVKPVYFEYWQGRDNRLHDRLSYVKEKDSGLWNLSRLAP